VETQPQVEERQLIERVLRGDKVAQREFYDRHVDRIFGLAQRMVGDQAAARDCTQLTFIRLFDRLRSFRGEAALSTWVHAVAVNVMLEWRRKTKNWRRSEVDLEAARDVAAPSPVFDGIVNETIRRAIDALGARYRAVVVMHDIEGYTHEEIGAALGIGTAASKTRLSRAHKKLKEALAEYAGDLAYER
jgi:RNA polymerase sigma-70 factor (ECF subfamily)